MKEVQPKALFRLSVLGPLVSRESLARGELQRLIGELSARAYAIPGSRRRHIGAKTIEAWYYAWRSGGIEALAPKPRADRGSSKIAPALQEAILAAKRANTRRSVRRIVRLLEAAGTTAAGTLLRSAVHRLLARHGLSQPPDSAHQSEERRSFAAEFAGSIWYGDVMHGPRVAHQGRLRKTYLVSLIDDASRLVARSAFCLGVQDKQGQSLGEATLLDEIGNARRARRKPDPSVQPAVARSGPNLVEIAHQQYHGGFSRKED